MAGNRTRANGQHRRLRKWLHGQITRRIDSGVHPLQRLIRNSAPINAFPDQTTTALHHGNITTLPQSLTDSGMQRQPAHLPPPLTIVDNQITHMRNTPRRRLHNRLHPFAATPLHNHTVPPLASPRLVHQSIIGLATILVLRPLIPGEHHARHNRQRNRQRGKSLLHHSSVRSRERHQTPHHHRRYRRIDMNSTENHQRPSSVNGTIRPARLIPKNETGCSARNKPRATPS